MIEGLIENKLASMDKRKILFITGEHSSGKTEHVINYLKSKYGSNYNSHYVDVGMYLKERLQNNRLKIYRLYPAEFLDDAEVIVQGLIKDKYSTKGNVIVFDHLEFILSENYIGWISILDKVTSYVNSAIILIPSEYKDLLPLNAYQNINIDALGGVSNAN